jgi:hypothetical protein
MISFLLCFVFFFPFQGDISDRRTRNPVLATLCNFFFLLPSLRTGSRLGGAQQISGTGSLFAGYLLPDFDTTVPTVYVLRTHLSLLC